VVDIDSGFPSERIIRRVRYSDVEIINLSTENKDVTFNATVASANSKEKVNRWAYYRETLEKTLVEAIEKSRLASILVCRYRLTTEGKDGKPNYNFLDIIVDAALN